MNAPALTATDATDTSTFTPTPNGPAPPPSAVGNSMDTAAECSVSITGYSNRQHWVEIDVEKFDFVEVLGEIVAAGGGRLDTPEPVAVPDAWEL